MYTCIHCGEGANKNISHGEGVLAKKAQKKGGFEKLWALKLFQQCHNF